MFCHNCGTQIHDGAIFCPKCGTKIASVDAGQQPMSIPVTDVKDQQVSGVMEDTQQAPSNNNNKANEGLRKAANIGRVLMWGSLVLLMLTSFLPLRINPVILVAGVAIGIILSVLGAKRPLGISKIIELVVGIILLVAVAIYFMSSGGESNKYKDSSTSAETSTSTETPISSNTMADDSDYPIFAEALWNLIMYNTLPDGNIANDLDGKIDGMWDKFAICDIDQDGATELLIKIESGSESGCGQYIYQVNSDHTGLELLYSFFTDAVYYDTGFIKEDWSHNQGLSENFWPYSIFQWEMDGCREVAGVDAWEKMAWETDFSGNSFPDGVDIDGNGIVYFIGGESGIDYDNPVDDAEYNDFVKKYFSTGKEIYVPWQDITEENVEVATGYTTEDYGALSEEGDTDYWDEEDGGFYWVGEDDFKISDPSLVGRWRTYEGDTLELDEYGTAPTVFTFWGVLNGKPDSVTWEASNGYLILSAHYSTEQRWEIRPRGNIDGHEAVTDELFLRDEDIPKDETYGEYYREHTGNEGLSGVWKSRQMLVDLILYEDGTGMMGEHMLTWEADETTFYCYPVIEKAYDYIVSGDTLTIFFSDGSRTYVKVGD